MNFNSIKGAQKAILSMVFFCGTSLLFSQGFLHRDGTRIVDGSGKNILLRGLGIGGLMVQEGYMLKTSDFAGPQYQIKQKISDLIGANNTKLFYDAYKKNGLTKRDVDSLAAWGFNSIRLPMHYNLYTLPLELEPVKGKDSWLEEGFEMTDSILSWCAANKMYLILDLHAAPGGQGKDASISDYDASQPSLWENQENQNKMISFWNKIAARYQDNPWIGGYDIINEPNWNFSSNNSNGCDETKNNPLRSLQINITEAIRKVDTNHLIIIEGNCWGNNYNGIFPLWDENMALSFHKYWNTNDKGSIQQMVTYRDSYNVPIWLGESGENSNVWFTDAIKLVESNNIGWAFWPMKKIDNIAGITSVNEPKGYNNLLEYWKGKTVSLSVSEANTTLQQIAAAYKIENVIIHYDVLDAMFRQVHSQETKPYKLHNLSSVIFASEYDMGQIGKAYYDKDAANYHVSTGIDVAWNSGNAMRNDGVDIAPCTDNISNGYQVMDIQNGEWLQYTISASKSVKGALYIRYSSDTTFGKIYVADSNGIKIAPAITLPSTGGKTNWKTLKLANTKFAKGNTSIRLFFEKGGFQLNYLEFKNQKSRK
jgi:endoglucanase